MLSKEKTIADVSSWANISDDLLRLIATLTRSPQHHSRMTAVCRSWRASLADQKINFPAVCLMLRNNGDYHRFYSISGEIFDELDLLEFRGWDCFGSPFGWLPNSNCIVFAIYDGRRHIGFAKPGDLAWRALIYDDDGGFGGGIFIWDDVIYFKCNFYGCLNSAHPKSVKFASRPPNFHGGHTCYLFDLDGNLCMTEYIDYRVEFVIFKLDMDTKSWEKIYSLGDSLVVYYTDELTDVEVNGIYEVEKYLDKDIGLGSLSLFLGNCCTFNVAAADYPGRRPNCIYILDDTFSCSDVGIYDCQNLALDKNFRA
ncbi:hypothetical protein E1A91_A10G262300v1 [Gossypium mustelinum]|uniref:KIB1-4 beta-propeller domain-containing protein n=1 Tax=Gossypium mustelinum TaxID=34275 RepID=A0A5D2XRP5_GOSMU|nr:hypothetical protein E1A91_A10G262300v1 [Gossypium mustelinum]